MLWLMDDALTTLEISDVFYRLEWERRFDRAGRVEVRLPSRFREHAAHTRYLYDSESKELALIERFERSEDSFVTLVGRAAVGLLAHRVLSASRGAGGRVPEAVADAITDCFSGLRATAGMTVNPDLPEDDSLFVGAQEGEELLSFCLRQLNPLGMFLEVKAQDQRLITSIRKGEDKSDTVVFSDSFGNLHGLLMQTPLTPSVAYVLGEHADGTAKCVKVTRSGDGVRSECFVSGTAIKRRYRDDDGNQVTRSETEYENMLRALGESALAKSHDTLEASVKNVGAWRYGSDYRIGDLVRVEDRASGMQAICRVMGCLETRTADGTEITAWLSRTDGESNG